jgi:hypothetical protein
MNVEELESAITRLTPEELSAFSRWFEVYMAAQWDEQIERDILAGRFKEAGDRATADFEAGRATSL